jgi:hypothetical protein
MDPATADWTDVVFRPDLHAAPEPLSGPVQAKMDNASGQDGAPVQRYTEIGGASYTMGGAAGDTMFESQALSRGGGHHGYVRTEKSQRGDGQLDVQDQHYHAGAGAWQNAGAARQEALPALRISQNGLLAIESTEAQPRGFYIDAGLLANTNGLIKDQGVVRLLPTGATVNIPVVPGQPWTAHPLSYVTLTTADQGADAAAGAPDLTRIAAHACDGFAAHVKGVNVQGAGAVLNRGARPGIGDNYHIHETGGMAFDGGGAMRDYSTAKPTVGKDELQKMLIQLDRLEAEIEEKGISATEAWFYSSNARALLDTWGDHYEGVITEDGADNITAVNYNRNTEARWERRRVFREYYLAMSQFRQDVRAYVNLTHGGQTITWQQVRTLADGQIGALLAALGGAHVNVAQDLADIQTTVDDQAVNMWYFSMYGPNKQSFHANFAPRFWNPETKIS